MMLARAVSPFCPNRRNLAGAGILINWCVPEKPYQRIWSPSMTACSKIGLALLLIYGSPRLFARVQPTHGFDLFSAQEETQAGQQAAAEVSQQMPLLPENDPVTQY